MRPVLLLTLVAMTGPALAAPGDLLPAEFVRALALAAVAFAAALLLLLVVARRMRLRRREIRLAISGLRDGPRFRMLDAVTHAVRRAGKVDGARLDRALEIARDTTEMDLTSAHMAELVARGDRLLLPLSLRWMRRGLTREERLVIFNAAASVMLASGRLSRADRRYLKVLTHGLGLKRHELRDLQRLVVA